MTGMRVGIDIGGTFTDLTLIDERTGSEFREKVLTTPDAPERGVIDGLVALEKQKPGYISDLSNIVHATTLVTNALLEAKGAKTGLITTEGFEDILEIGREIRYNIYDLFIKFPPPIVEKPLRMGVRERVMASGRILVPLDEEGVRQAARRFRAEGVQAVAIAFLHSYHYSGHELRAAEIVAEEIPGIFISMSHEVHPQPKEFERTSTAVIDAYVKPIAARYLADLVEELKGRRFGGRLLMMQSNGGAVTVETASRFPAQIIESGPAAGVEAASHYGRKLGIANLLSFDMGGTTAKLCLIKDGRAAQTRDFEVGRVHRFRAGSGYPVAINVYDLLEIGAGGGSIAQVDGLGLLEVGPESASSVPGPACYGRGGRKPTVTDADLALGFLGADSFLGGDMRLDVDAALDALAATVGEPLGFDAHSAAWGIYDLVNEKMAAAGRVYVAEKGEDPSQLTLVGFGGAGPVHAVEVARKLGCATVIIPPAPGVMSSLGLLAAPVSFERTRTLRQALSDIVPTAVEEMYRELEIETRQHLPEGSPRYSRHAELWYVGQDYPITVEVPGDWRDPGVLASVAMTFERSYEGLYGRRNEGAAIELVSLRVTASMPVPELQTAPLPQSGRPVQARSRPAFFQGEMRSVPVFSRSALGLDFEVTGPAIIEERESTTIVGPGDRVSVNGMGCLVVHLAHAAESPAPALAAQ